MKRNCLLSDPYGQPPMKLGGDEVFYSPLANEIIRELNSAGFNGDGDGKQTHYQGMCEGLVVMWLLAKGDREKIQWMRRADAKERSAYVNDFILDNESNIERLVEQLIDRITQAMAASVEGAEDEGKSQEPVPMSSPSLPTTRTDMDLIQTGS